ncbi:MAG: hypothetical protein FJ296_04910 [Planctomycetes bacterium]|nr:hypothetical protein [Planctomycetota bacterium]
MTLRLNIRKLKAGIWLAAAGTFVCAGWVFYDIFTLKQDKHYEPRKRDIFVQQVLKANVHESAPKVQKNIFVENEYRALWDARIDGSVPPPPPAAGGEQAPPEEKKPEAPPIETIVDVDLILWAPQPELRFAAIAYKSGGASGAAAATAASAAAAGKQTRLHLSEGDPLQPPWDDEPYNGKVVRIDEQEVVFHWGEGEITVTPKLGADGKGAPVHEFDPQEAEDLVAGLEVPARTEQLKEGHWILGLEDREQAARDPQTFMEQQLRVRTVTPAAGGRSSLELTQDPEPGSLAAKFGAKKGDRLISVNGVPLSSISSGINWFKQNPNEPVYVVVYEPAGTGKQETITIHNK